MSIPEVHSGLAYSAFMADLLTRREARTYLEIGVDNGFCLSQIVVERAIGVDPAFRLTVDPTIGKKSLSLHQMTSDSFFRSQPEVLGIDFAFLDGLHVFEYLLRDIYNVERHCSPGALIAIHDTLPLDHFMVSREDTGGAWTGDVWKIVPILEQYRPDLNVVLVDCFPTGLVVITNLDPSSDVLRRKYLEIVRAYKQKPNDREALESFYAGRKIVSTQEITHGVDHSLFFDL